MRSPRNGIKTDPRPPKDYWGAVPPPPADASPAEQFTWTLLALRTAETRIARMTSVALLQNERLDQLDRSITDLWRTLTITAFCWLGIVLAACAVIWWRGF